MRFEGHGHRDGHRYVAQLGDGGQEIGLGIVPRWRDPGDRLGRGHHHPVGDPLGAHRDRAQPDAGKDIGVVGLVDLELGPVADQGRKRTAGADHRAPLAPGLEILGRRLGA